MNDMIFLFASFHINVSKLYNFMFQNMRKHLEFNVLENCSHFSHSDNILLFEFNNLAEL